MLVACGSWFTDQTLLFKAIPLQVIIYSIFYKLPIDSSSSIKRSNNRTTTTIANRSQTLNHISNDFFYIPLFNLYHHQFGSFTSNQYLCAKVLNTIYGLRWDFVLMHIVCVSAVKVPQQCNFFGNDALCNTAYLSGFMSIFISLFIWRRSMLLRFIHPSILWLLERWNEK